MNAAAVLVSMKEDRWGLTSESFGVAAVARLAQPNPGSHTDKRNLHRTGSTPLPASREADMSCLGSGDLARAVRNLITTSVSFLKSQLLTPLGEPLPRLLGNHD